MSFAAVRAASVSFAAVRAASVIMAATLVASVIIGAACSSASGEAELRAHQDLPADVQHEIDQVWGGFTSAFSAQIDSAGPVGLVLVADVPGGDARYLVDEAVIEIEIPTSPRRFRDSLAHELGHHLEHRAEDFETARVQVSLALGIDPQSWFAGPSWQTTPSEIWAESVAMVVNGERPRFGRTMPIDDQVIETVRDWGREP